jgi:hypothetical protein
MSATEQKPQSNFDLKTNEGIKNSILGYLRAMFKKARNGEDVQASITVIMVILAKAFMERESIQINEKDPLGTLVAYLKKENFTNGDDAELEDDKGMKLCFSLDRKPGSTRLFLLSATITEGENILIQYGDGESVRESSDDEKTIRDGATYLIFRDETGVIEHLYLQKDKTFKYFGNGKPRANQPQKERPSRGDSSAPKPRRDFGMNSSTNATEVIKALVEQNEKLMKLVANSVAGPSNGKGKGKESPKH